MFLIPLTIIEVTKAEDNLTTALSFAGQKNNPDIKVSISSPKYNDSVQGLVDVVVTANDINDTISAINLYLGNQLLAIVKNPSTANQFMAKVSWDTTKVVNGKKTLSAIAFNSRSQQNSSDTVPVQLSNTDSTPPNVSFSNINDGDYLSGNNFFVKLEASDANGIALVKVSLDGTTIKRFSKVPYEFGIDISKLTPGNHVLSSQALDYIGNESKAQVVFYRGLKNIKD